MAKELYELGDMPPLGEIPEKMHAWVTREERFGEPMKAFQREVVPVPDIDDDEVLLYVMAAGINYNNVWAGLGVPVNVIKARQKSRGPRHPEDFHIGGSDASGIVYKVGKNVTNVKVGDEVVVHCGMWDVQAPEIKAGMDPMYHPSFWIWGYESTYGSFAQFTRVQGHQCLPKPKHLTWEAASSYMLVGATAYRMLCAWDEHKVSKGDVVLVWGGAGGLGSMAIQICRAFGAIPVAVVSEDDKFDYCKKLGAQGCINRKNFDHWGMLPHWKDNVGYSQWLKGVRKFGEAIWEVLGEKRAPRIVFEHPGETTIPTSMYVCDTGGMVVICAGTTGFNATIDLRYLWMRQKRIQGSHFANDDQAKGINDLVLQGLVDPCMSRAFTFDEMPHSHQLMYENKHPHGNMALLVNAPTFGLGATASTPSTAAAAPVMVMSTPKVAPFPLSTPAMASPDYVSQHLDDTEITIVDDGTVVKDLMHTGLIACKPDDTLETVASLMIDKDVHAIIVMDGDAAVGVVSQTDMVLARQGRSAADAKALPARAIMTPGCATCDVATPLSKAVSIMTGLRIHRLVVTEQDVPVGVISMTDVVRKLIVEGK